MWFRRMRYTYRMKMKLINKCLFFAKYLPCVVGRHLFIYFSRCACVFMCGYVSSCPFSDTSSPSLHPCLNHACPPPPIMAAHQDLLLSLLLSSSLRLRFPSSPPLSSSLLLPLPFQSFSFRPTTAYLKGADTPTARFQSINRLLFPRTRQRPHQASN